MEIDTNLISMLILVIIALLGFLYHQSQRLTRVETKQDVILEWIACLNGEVSNEKFMKKLKTVMDKNYKDRTILDKL